MAHLWITLALCLTLMSALWLPSLVLRDVSIVDIFWAPVFAIVGGATIWLEGGAQLSGWITQTLVTLWALRLGGHILIRRWKSGKEDHRYTAIRRKFGARFPLLSLPVVFWLQGLLLWVISWPLQVAVTAIGTTPLLLAGWLMTAAGVLVEALADAQLTAFRSQRGNEGRVLDTGLWRFSRHPNYFGDFLIWWGFFLAGIAAGAPWWTVLAPIVMSALLLHFSGVGLMEDTITERRPDYRRYIQRTSAFFPWPPAKD